MYKYEGVSLQTMKLNLPVYIKQEPYVGEDSIYIPLEWYMPEGIKSEYKCILTKEMFVEAYDKWIKDR